MTVRSVDLPADRDPGTIRGDRPLPTLFAAIGRVRAGAFTTERGLVLRRVDSDFGQIEPDDPVIRAERFFDDGVEHTGVDPFVASSSQCRLGAFAEPASDIPRAARDEPEQDRFEAVPIRDPRSVTAQRVLIDGFWQERLDGRPDSADNTRMKCQHGQ